MKRRELERRLRIAGCYLKREGSLIRQSQDRGGGSRSTAPGDQRAIGNHDLEKFESRLKAGQVLWEEVSSGKSTITFSVTQIILSLRVTVREREEFLDISR